MVLNACPRCRGDLLREIDARVEFVCIQCGFRTESIGELKRSLATRERELEGEVA
jgi:hypothetical protein